MQLKSVVLKYNSITIILKIIINHQRNYFIYIITFQEKLIYGDGDLIWLINRIEIIAIELLI